MKKEQKEKIGKGRKGKIFLGLIVVGIFLMILIGGVEIVSSQNPAAKCDNPAGCVDGQGNYIEPGDYAKDDKKPSDLDENNLKQIKKSEDIKNILDNKNADSVVKKALDNKESTDYILKTLNSNDFDSLLKHEGFQDIKKGVTSSNSKSVVKADEMIKTLKTQDSEKAKKFVKELNPNINTDNLNLEKIQGYEIVKGRAVLKYGAGNKIAEIPATNSLEQMVFGQEFNLNADGTATMKSYLGEYNWDKGTWQSVTPGTPVSSPTAGGAFSNGLNDPFRPQQPGGQLGGGEGGGGEGGGGAGGGGDAQQKMQQAFQMAQQMVGIVKEFFAGLQANLQNDAEQKAKTGNSAAELQAGAQEGMMTLENAKAEVTTSDGSKAVVVTSPEPVGKATFGFDAALNAFTMQTIYPTTSVADMSSSGAGAIITNEDKNVAGILSPSGTETTVTNKADSTDPTQTTSAANVGSIGNTGSIVTFLALMGNAVSDVVNGQSVKFIKQDIEIKGQEIVIYTLKPFNHIEGDGKGLLVGDGNVDIKFENDKTLYPRIIKTNEYFINKITNKQDPDKYFALIPGGTKGNYFLDNKKRISVGDISADHPKLKGIKIAEIRKDMWKK